MATILGSCRELLVELAVYLWCTVTRLVFALWFCWKKPRPLPPVTDELLLRSATSLAADIRNDKVKSVDLVSAYIRRIREVQPIINAVVEERFEEALKDAEEVDRLVTSGTMSASQMSKEKPLLGLPFTSKNSIAIKGMRQDAGSLFWHGRRAEEDAPSVALLRAAGAIPLALTNVPEMCMWGDSQNLVDGCTRNPHDTRRNPGGSSGGEGSLLAASGSLIGLGTDIGGSIRIPAAFCGIFGHKPTAGVVPNTGLLPDVGENLEQFNCVGPMTRFAEDLPLVFNVLAGSTTMRLRLNEKVNLNMLKLYYMDTEGSLYISRTTNDARRAVRQALFTIILGWSPCLSSVPAPFQMILPATSISALDDCAPPVMLAISLDVPIRPPASSTQPSPGDEDLSCLPSDLPFSGHGSSAYNTMPNCLVFAMQVVRYLNETHGLQGHPLQLPELRFGTFEWFKVSGVKEPKPLSEVFRPGGFNTVVELLRHLVGAGRHTLAALVACIMKQLCRFRSKPKGEAYATSLENVRDRFEETLGDNGVLVLPAATSAALFQNQDLMFFDSAGMTSLFSLFKVPSTVCPVLRSADNLPLCVQVVAKRGNDRLCLAVAREIEKRFGGWIDPSAKVKGRA